ncbi:hypothetical protein KLEP174_gp13 [Pseudomonas phage vB_PcuM_ KLEP17-4]|nr:hypothetical protein KLEP174_gp13 [Pseudomonas phage vB_PcuM_ KLEP17-4]
MAAVDSLTVKVKTDIEYHRYMLVIFPIAKYIAMGEHAKLTVLGLPVYERCGYLKWFCGYAWVSHE